MPTYRLTAIVCALSLWLAAPAAQAQPSSTTVKTPPLSASDTFVLPIDTHIPTTRPPWLGWQGAVVKLHVLDASELDVVSVHSTLFTGNPLGPPNGPVVPASSSVLSPFGPAGSNQQSAPFSANYYSTLIPSGITVVASQSINIGSAVFDARAASLGANSDIDASAMIWNIWHMRAGISTTITTLPIPVSAQAMAWATTGVTASSAFHRPSSLYWFPNGGLSLGATNGHWVPFNQSVTFFQTTGGSGYLATLARTVNLGIEHVPEPATGTLFAAGLVALAASRGLRRRRLVA